MFAHLSTWILVYLMARGFKVLMFKNIPFKNTIM